MKYKSLVTTALSAALVLSPVSNAMAYDHGHHGHGGRNFGLFAAGAAIIGGAALLLTAPIRAVAEAPGYAPQDGYGYPQEAYNAPQPRYYAPPQAYAPPPQAYYAPPPYYYAPPRPRVYYVPAPAYYQGY